MNEVVRYEPPKPMFNDTLLAFKAFDDAHSGNTVTALIEADPLGPVNKIVTLMAGKRRIRSALAPIRTGSVVTLGRGGSNYFETFSSGPGWRTLAGHPEAEPERPKPPHWYVDVDGRRVLEVPEYETWPPIRPPSRVPWRRRARKALNARSRALVNRVAKRFGYVHEDDVEVDW